MARSSCMEANLLPGFSFSGQPVFHGFLVGTVLHVWVCLTKKERKKQKKDLGHAENASMCRVR
jgi:hypothetical protein